MQNKVLKRIIFSKMKSNKLSNLLLICVALVNALLLESILSYYKTILVQTEAFGQKQDIELIVPLGLILFITIFAAIVYYNILHISFESQKDFFVKLKVLKCSSAKIQVLILLFLFLLNILGTLSGGAAGWFLGKSIAEAILPFQPADIVVQVKIYEILLLLFFSNLSLVLGSLWPIYKIRKIELESIEEKNNKYLEGRKEIKKILGCPAIINLSIANLVRYDKRIVTSMLLLVCGFTLANTIYIKYKSYSFDKYLEQKLLSDFEIGHLENENPDKLEDELKEIENIFEKYDIVGKGYIYSECVELSMTDEVYDTFFRYYDDSILKEMSKNISWIQEYQEVRDSKKCDVTILSVNDFLLDKLIEKSEVYSGAIDKELLQNGNGIIIQGVPSDENKENQPYEIGNSVTFNGRTYVILAIIDAPLTLTEINSPSNFGITFYLPQEHFRKAFSDSNIEKVYFNANKDELLKIADELKKFEAKYNDVQIQSKKSLYRVYQKEINNSILLEVFVAFFLIIMGMLCMINSMVDSIRSRKKEFALMNVIGASKIQIEKMLIYEGAIFAGITVIVSYITNFIVSTIINRIYMEQQWTVQYYFSLLPLNIISVLFICTCLLVPIVTYYTLLKDE